MLRTNSTFNTYNALTEKKPVVLININGFTNQYCTGTFSGIAGTDKKLVSDVVILGGKVDLINFDTSPFGIDFDVIDKDNTFFDEIAANNIIGEKIIIKIGFQEIASSNFMTLPVCYVTDMEILGDNITFRISARDKRYNEMQRKVFRTIPTSELSSDLAAAALSCDVSSATGFTTADSAVWGRSTNTYIKIGNEICRYTNIVGGTFTITRGDLNTLDTAHVIGEKVSEVYYIEETPIEFLIQILSGYNNTDGAPETFDQALPTGWGLNLSVSIDIDIIQMMNEYFKWEYSPSTITWKYQWIVDEAKNAESFIREQILKILPGFFIYTENAKLGIKIWDFRITNEGATYDTITTSFKPNIKIDDKYIVTHIEAYEIFNNGSKIFGTPVTHYATDLDAVIGKIQIVEMRPEINNFPLATHTDNELWYKYLTNSTHLHLLITYNSFIEDWIHQIGDVCAITNSNLLDIGAGSRGWTAETIQILEQTIYINSKNSYCSFSGIAYDHLDEIGDTIGYEIANLTDLDDSSLSYDATDTVVVQAADAYYDVQTYTTNIGFHLISFKISATLPGGANSDEYVRFSLYAGEIDGANINAVNHYNDKKPVYYNASWTGTIYFELVLYVPNNSYDIERIKVDYFDRSAGAGDQLADVTLQQVKIIQRDLALTETV